MRANASTVFVWMVAARLGVVTTDGVLPIIVATVRLEILVSVPMIRRATMLVSPDWRVRAVLPQG